jgi:hypothetical protein
MTPTIETSGYRLSPRVTLQPGDTFRVSGGPYYRLADGRRVPMAARGVFRLVEVVRQRSRVYLLAYGREGWALIHVEGRRRSPVPGLVARPYRAKRAGRKDCRLVTHRDDA